MSHTLRPEMEHKTLTDAAGPHCLCGWIPRTAGPRALTAVNVHVSKSNKAARAHQGQPTPEPAAEVDARRLAVTGTPIPHRTLPIRPTSSEYAMQEFALEQGGKQEEVLVKAARDLIVAAAIYEHAGSGRNGVHRYSMDAAGTRFAKHAIDTGTLQPSDLLEISARIGHAARVLCRYLT